jgi:dTDP-4-amino-4,6-dideoxygalactose transaminase
MRGAFPNAEKACREVLSLPMGPYVSDAQVIYVAEQVRAFYKSAIPRKATAPRW